MTDPRLELNRLVASGVVSRIQPVDLARFVSFVKALPWRGTHLDWEAIGGSRLEWTAQTDVLTWVSSQRVGRHAYVAAAHSRSTGIVGSTATMIERFDEITWGYPGEWFLCGAKSLEPLELVFEDFAEYQFPAALIARS